MRNISVHNNKQRRKQNNKRQTANTICSREISLVVDWFFLYVQHMSQRLAVEQDDQLNDG